MTDFTHKHTSWTNFPRKFCTQFSHSLCVCLCLCVCAYACAVIPPTYFWTPVYTNNRQYWATQAWANTGVSFSLQLPSSTQECPFHSNFLLLVVVLACFNSYHDERLAVRPSHSSTSDSNFVYQRNNHISTTAVPRKLRLRTPLRHPRLGTRDLAVERRSRGYALKQPGRPALREKNCNNNSPIERIGSQLTTWAATRAAYNSSDSATET